MSRLNSERWAKLWRSAASIPPPAEAFPQLLAMYAEPHRHYHNQQHIADCLAQFDRVTALTTHPLAVELALWFHDAIYNTRASDNEARSADLARQWLQASGADTALIEAVSCLILVTKNHDGSLHPDAPLLVDVDLSILGQPPERFWEYERQIREEYAWVDAALFAAKRAEILQRFLARPRIYQTDFFLQELEAPARQNLRASMQCLGKS